MRRVDESESLISDLGGGQNNDRKQSVLQAVVKPQQDYDASSDGGS